MTLRRAAGVLAGILLVVCVAACGRHDQDDNLRCTRDQRARAAATTRYVFPDLQERPAAGSAPPSAVTVRVGERLEVTVAYPASDHPTVPAISGDVLCEIRHAERASGSDATFLARVPGEAVVSATTEPGARAFRPNLTVAVHVRP